MKTDHIMDDHLSGYPVSRATHERFGCTCTGCMDKVHEHRVRARAERVKDEALQLQIEMMFTRDATYTEIMEATGLGYAKIKKIKDKCA